jgi:YVTN family beta-propeller protein
VTAEIGGTVTDIDTKTREIVTTIPIDRGEGKPVGVVVSPNGKRVYVASGRTGTLSVIDAATYTVLASIPVGKRPWGVAITRDARYVYTANGLSNDVSVLDTSTNRVVATIKVGQRPWGVAAK